MGVAQRFWSLGARLWGIAQPFAGAKPGCAAEQGLVLWVRSFSGGGRIAREGGSLCKIINSALLWLLHCFTGACPMQPQGICAGVPRFSYVLLLLAQHPPSICPAARVLTPKNSSITRGLFGRNQVVYICTLYSHHQVLAWHARRRPGHGLLARLLAPCGRPRR